MNWADYALLTILAVSMGIGLWRGFVVEVLSLTVWIAAFWLTIGFGTDVAAQLTGIGSPSARLFVGHAGVFITVLIVGGLLVWSIGKMIASTGLSATDRVLGLGFGLARGLVLACVGVLMLGFTPVPQEGWWAQARLIPSAQRGAEWMVTFLPADAAQHLSFPGYESPLLPAPAGGALPAPEDGPADDTPSNDAPTGAESPDAAITAASAPEN
jgi:membrane protein required for colicin V production